MKKTYLVILFSIIFSLLFINNVNAQGSSGYKCANNQCLTCNLSEDGCREGVCNAFRCEIDSETPPMKPFITNLEELSKEIGSNNIKVKGFGEANKRFIIEIDGEKVAEGNVGGEGIFESQFNSNKSTSGEYKLEVFLINESGVESEKSAPVTLKIIADKPEITLINLKDSTGFENTLVSGSTTPISVIELLSGSDVSYKTGSDSNGNFDLVIRNLKNGQNRFTIKVTDKFGNTNNQDISINFDENNSTRLEKVTQSQNSLTISIPQGITFVEIYKNDLFLEKITAQSGELTYDLASSNSAFTNYKFIGGDQAGNKTSPLEIQQTNTTVFALIVVSGFIAFMIVGFLIYLIYKGKIKIPFFKSKNVDQEKLDLDFNSTEEKSTEEKNTENIIPGNIKKEY